MGKHTITRAIVPSLLAVMGCWVLFVAAFTVHELLLGAGFTILTIAISSFAWHEMSIRFWPTPKQIITVWRLPWYVLSGSWEMILILARDAAGKTPGSFFRATLFDHAEGSEGISQRVLATGYTTVAPNFIVIGVTRDHLFFHQIEQSEVPRMIRDLEAAQ